jgi:hypothetical protein
VSAAVAAEEGGAGVGAGGAELGAPDDGPALSGGGAGPGGAGGGGRGGGGARRAGRPGAPKAAKKKGGSVVHVRNWLRIDEHGETSMIQADKYKLTHKLGVQVGPASRTDLNRSDLRSQISDLRSPARDGDFFGQCFHAISSHAPSSAAPAPACVPSA